MTCNTRLRVTLGLVVSSALILYALTFGLYHVGAAEHSWIVASGATPTVDQGRDSNAGKQTPEQKFASRHPQPVLVGDLVGLAVLDENDSTLGYVRQVVKAPDGKIALIVPYSSWFGWVRTEWGKRAVAVPIEVVTILARQIDAEDLPRNEFDSLPTWMPGKDTVLSAGEKTLIGLGRR